MIWDIGPYGSVHVQDVPHSAALDYARGRAVQQGQRQRVRICGTFPCCWVIEDAG